MSETRKAHVEALTRTLLGVAHGDFTVRAPRTYEGDDWDVLAFLVNSTADEVAVLVSELEAERVELEQTQKRLAHAEKLAALGRLAAGVAHEMNQPLTVIASLVDLLRLEPASRVDSHEEELAMVAEAARQLAKIVDSIRLFGRGTGSQKVPIAPLRPVREATQLLSARLHEASVELSLDAREPLPEILADVDHLRRVFINLLGNAIAAVEASERDRRIEITVAHRDSSIEYLVRDNGPGIDERDLPKLFEPFFTTKPVGEGTGLGLSLAHGIVVDHGGTIECVASSGEGTTFSVRLPTEVVSP